MTSPSESIDIEAFLGLNGIKVGEGRQGQASLSDFLPHLSASSIGMLYRCPRQFQHRYLRHEKERPGEGLVIGSFFHGGLEMNYGQKIESHTDVPLSDVIQYLGDVVVPDVLEESGGPDNVKWDSSQDEAHKDSERILSAYYRTVVPRVQPIAVESKFQIAFPGVEVPIIGYVDTEEQARVIDTKTGRQASRKLKPSWQLQARLYSFARQKPTEYHSISRAKTPTIVTALESEAMVMPVPSDGQMSELTRLVNTAAELVRHFLSVYGVDEEWPTWGAIPDWSRNVLPCDMCGWRAGCPAWS